MRWVVAVLSLTVICSILGSAAALVVGKPSLKLLRSDRQAMSVDAKPAGRPAGPRMASDDAGSPIKPPAAVTR
jgi:hypothetical protein